MAHLKSLVSALTPKSIRLALRQELHQYGMVARRLCGDGEPFIPLFILALPRTGSWLLADYLASTKMVAVAGEILNPQIGSGIRRRQNNQTTVLRHVRNSLGSLRGSVRAAKLLLDQLEHHELSLGELYRYFPNARYILLFRESLLEQFVSYRVARMTGEWRTKRDANHGTIPKILVDAAELQRFCERQRARYTKAATCHWLAHLGVAISYESLTNSPQSVFDERIFPLLGVPSVAIYSKMRKQAVATLEHRIANYAELMSQIDPELVRISADSIGWPTSCNEPGSDKRRLGEVAVS